MVLHGKIMRMLSRVLRKMGASGLLGSTAIEDTSTIETFIADPENTFLVSFPRTGSHWLRMIMELYFEQPSLVRVFYYPKRVDYLMLHTHDLELDVERTNVVYLYRDPVDTIFSQICHHQDPLTHREAISYWSDLYGRHLDKWLCQEQFTNKKTILTYEGMQKNLVAEFERIVQHFGQTLDRTRLKNAAVQVSKEEVKHKTRHDPRVVQLQAPYEVKRREFREKHGDWVWEVLTSGRPHLVKYFYALLLPGSEGLLT